MKYEWRKQEKELYLPKDKPELINVPRHKFFMISGKGNPNEEEFSEKVGILYSLAYAVRMMPKQGVTPEGYFEYTVYPLEGLWSFTEKGKQLEEMDKNELIYTIMIRQPDFVTDEIADMAFESAYKKKKNSLVNEASFKSIEDGLSLQIMHNGPYDDEPASFQKLKDYMMENNFKLRQESHREIYISDASRTEASKLKTVLRYIVE